MVNAFRSQGKPETKSTETFIEFFDKFFDCLNVSNTTKGARLRKPALEPYTSSDDCRFEVLNKHRKKFVVPNFQNNIVFKGKSNFR